jgi:hypothetical protein
MSGMFALVAGTGSGVTPAEDGALHGSLERIAQRRIFFAHQSVGLNLLDGVKRLANVAAVTVRIAEAAPSSTVAPGIFAHIFVAENGYPLRKLEDFASAIDQQSPSPDIALVKFCYSDVTALTDVEAVFSRYAVTLDALKSRHSGTIFIHVTVPLTKVQDGPKAFLKRLIGVAPYGSVENSRREKYNALLRRTYLGREPIFDLARIESTAPDGTIVTREWAGEVAPALVTAYTDDGGHLNAAGGLRAARELIAVLAAIPNRPVTVGWPSR